MANAVGQSNARHLCRSECRLYELIHEIGSREACQIVLLLDGCRAFIGKCSCVDARLQKLRDVDLHLAGLVTAGREEGSFLTSLRAGSSNMDYLKPPNTT